MFHVGRHLADAVEEWDDRWQVDVDYNRTADRERLEWVKKYLPATEGRKEGAVLPDGGGSSRPNRPSPRKHVGRREPAGHGM